MSPVDDLSPSELNKVPIGYKAPEFQVGMKFVWSLKCQHCFIISYIGTKKMSVSLIPKLFPFSISTVKHIAVTKERICRIVYQVMSHTLLD